ncbi:MAG TPA: hypothetical protein VD710_09065 [Nitrososphaeraceae archaeon]|nr:hypothetical protein [Nitrososphaeraceae archaeon]
MEEFFCNICERSIEVLSLEKHTKESEHIARKKMLEKQLANNSKFQKSLRSATDLWKND